MKSILFFAAYLVNNMGIQCQRCCSDLYCQKMKIKNSVGELKDGVYCNDARFELNSLPECYTISSKTIRQYNKINYLKLEVEKFPHVSFLIEDPHQFRPPHARLVSLLKTNIPLIMFSSSLLRNTTRLKETKDEIFNDPNLQELEIYNASFNLRRHSWKLSYSLNRLNFSGNKYTNYDLTNCNDLTDIDFENNWLTRIPTLSRHPIPLLKKLNLMRNPLYDFTVNDIAGLCDLEELKLSYYSMGSGHRSCECRRIKEWIKKLKRGSEYFVFEGEFKCADISADKCAKYTLDEAQRLRDLCLLGDDWDTETWEAHLQTTVTSQSSNLIVVSILLVVAVLTVSTAAGAYFYYARRSTN